MKVNSASKQKLAKHLQGFQTTTSTPDSRNISFARASTEKMALMPSLKSNFSPKKSSGAFSPFKDRRSFLASNTLSPKMNYGTSPTNKQSFRMEEIQANGWLKAERQIRKYNNLMGGVNRAKSPQFHIDRQGNRDHEIDDTDLKLRARFTASRVVEEQRFRLEYFDAQECGRRNREADC